MQFHKSFYDKHGIKVTRDGVDRDKNPEQTRLEVSLLKTVQSGFITSNTVQSIEKAIEKYPDSEALKNYLYIAYTKTRQKDKAIACLHDTLKKHPNYAFAVINLVNHYLHQDDVANASRLLTEPYDVRGVEKEDIIHHSVFISYYQTVVLLALAKKDQKTAEKYHRLMFEYDPKEKVVKELAEEILEGRMDGMRERMTAPSVREVKSISKSIAGWETTDAISTFIHPEVKKLFGNDAQNMPKEVIEELLNLPRETFIQDLENVLADMVRRHAHYYKIVEWDEDGMAFGVHALYFLTELKAYDSLPTLLNVLRQDEEFIEFWFSDALHDFFLPTLYRLGNAQLPLLQAFITESHLYNASRGLASMVATQVALRQPERRGEVIQWYKEVIQTHLDQADNDGLIDNFLLGDLVVGCLNITAIELEPEITQLFDKGWIPSVICGDLNDVKESLHNPKDFRARIEPLPMSIYEMYDGGYTDIIENPELDAFRANYLENLEDDPYSSFLMNRRFGQSLRETMSDEDDGERYYKQQETVRRVEPKLGRNDPCHCGSGKKYKKCHGA
jgi:tetratricopeptide (TPR) repeat protein